MITIQERTYVLENITFSFSPVAATVLFGMYNADQRLQGYAMQAPDPVALLRNPVAQAYTQLSALLGGGAEYTDDGIFAEASTEIQDMRARHLQAIESICTLAGVPYTGKLTNKQYDELTTNIITAHPELAGIVAIYLHALSYTRNRLFELEGDGWWDNI